MYYLIAFVVAVLILLFFFFFFFLLSADSSPAWFGGVTVTPVLLVPECVQSVVIVGLLLSIAESAQSIRTMYIN